MSKSRITYSVIFLLVSIFILWSLASLYQYYRTGVEKVNSYDLGFNQLSLHQPQVKWLADDPDIKGEINVYARKDISDAYIDAWGILNLSIKYKRDLGMKENFTDIKAAQLAKNLYSSDSIIREDLNHNLKLHFISLDKQVVSLSDIGVILHTKIKSGFKEVTLKDTSDYKVILTLNEGKWKVNKFIRI